MFSCLKMLELPTFTYCNFRSSGMPPTTLYLSFYIVTAVIVTQKVSLKKNVYNHGHCHGSFFSYNLNIYFFSFKPKDNSLTDCFSSTDNRKWKPVRLKISSPPFRGKKHSGGYFK